MSLNLSTWLSILILIVVLAGTFIAKPADKESYRKAALSIFGIAVFFCWYYLEYYAGIARWSGLVTYLGLVVLIVAAGVLCVTPMLKRITTVPALLLLGLFLVSMFFRVGMDLPIKNRIAEVSGYFHTTNPFFLHGKPVTGLRHEIKDRGLVFNLPAGWVEKQHTSGMVYFEKRSADKLIAELRPGCFTKTDQPVAGADFGMSVLADSKTMDWYKYCFIGHDQYQCLIRGIALRAEQPYRIRWSWSKTRRKTAEQVTLDFVFYEKDERTLQEAEYISQSLAPLTGSTPVQNCIIPAAWLL
ncbi:MAG: hypothetical protein OEZ39_19965 [Gammaproteobacteria bacterium]|nr:hypothetical protein [Gammaproteobacteria bacterium]MDH5654145.1 hypothetical protein [Gammaproteobacteria bacterium]